MRSVLLLGEHVIAGTALASGSGAMVIFLLVAVVTARLVVEARQKAQRFTDQGLLVLISLLASFVAGCFVIAWVARLPY